MRKFSSRLKISIFFFNVFAILSAFCPKSRWIIEATDEVSQDSMANRLGNQNWFPLDQYFKISNLREDIKKTKKKNLSFLQVHNKIPQGEHDIPNVLSAASTLLSNIKQSLVKAPQILLDGSESSVEVAERLKHGAEVTGSYAVLNGLFGEKPKDNTGNGEYRRITQTPSLLYNITKHSDNSLIKQYPNFVIQWEKNKIKNKLRRTNEGIQSILRNEQLVYAKGQEVNSKQNYMLSKLQNTSADGEIGLGNNENELAHLTQEKAASLYFRKNKTVYLNPIQERYIRRHELHEPFLWERHVGRTRKTSLLPNLKEDEFPFSNSSPLKQSFEDTLNENKPLGKFHNMLEEQRQPIRRERLD